MTASATPAQNLATRSFTHANIIHGAGAWLTHTTTAGQRRVHRFSTATHLFVAEIAVGRARMAVAVLATTAVGGWHIAFAGLANAAHVGEVGVLFFSCFTFRPPPSYPSQTSSTPRAPSATATTSIVTPSPRHTTSAPTAACISHLCRSRGARNPQLPAGAH